MEKWSERQFFFFFYLASDKISFIGWSVGITRRKIPPKKKFSILKKMRRAKSIDKIFFKKKKNFHFRKKGARNPLTNFFFWSGPMRYFLKFYFFNLVVIPYNLVFLTNFLAHIHVDLLVNSLDKQYFLLVKYILCMGSESLFQRKNIDQSCTRAFHLCLYIPGTDLRMIFQGWASTPELERAQLVHDTFTEGRCISFQPPPIVFIQC